MADTKGEWAGETHVVGSTRSAGTRKSPRWLIVRWHIWRLYHSSPLVHYEGRDIVSTKDIVQTGIRPDRSGRGERGKSEKEEGEE